MGVVLTEFVRHVGGFLHVRGFGTIPIRVYWARLGSDSVRGVIWYFRFGSIRLSSVRFGSAPLDSARFGSVRFFLFGSVVFGPFFVLFSRKCVSFPSSQRVCMRLACCA